MSNFTNAFLGGVFSALSFTVASAEAQTAAPPTETRQGFGQRELQYTPHLAITPAAPATTAAPHFLVRAVSLYANNETGPDWPGSDEIYATFTLRPPGGTADAPGFGVRTSVFEDFDTGETKNFRDTQNCLTSVEHLNSDESVWNCHPAGDIGPLQFDVKLYEQDTGDDDLIGERNVHWSLEELASSGLQVGGTSEESVRIGGYTLTWRVERVS